MAVVVLGLVVVNRVVEAVVDCLVVDSLVVDCPVLEVEGGVYSDTVASCSVGGGADGADGVVDGKSMTL